jgi:hypothetical protein
VLLRELAPALFASRLGVVFDRGQRAAAEALARVEQHFTDHFRYLDLVRAACETALARTAREQAMQYLWALDEGEPTPLMTGGDPIVETLRRALEARDREVKQLRRRVKDLTASRLARIVARGRELLVRMAPEGSRRRWLGQKIRGILRALFGTPRRRAAGDPPRHKPEAQAKVNL